MKGEILKRSVVLSGHATSVSLEPEFWDALKTLAVARNIALNALINEIDQQRVGNLSSALRVYVLQNLQDRLEKALVPADEGRQDATITNLGV